MGILNRIWWLLMPGTTIKVKWPEGEICIKQEASDIWDYVRSADPNDHYRPYMETNVGRQGWDWDWTMMDHDVSQNTLTIKFRRGKEHWATLIALRWA
jgi:hypothetical protein